MIEFFEVYAKGSGELRMTIRARDAAGLALSTQCMNIIEPTISCLIKLIIIICISF